MQIEILPLAITMMAGPQIMSAIIFVTNERAIPSSAAFVLGVAVATTAGVAIIDGVIDLLGSSLDLGGPSSSSSGSTIQIVLIALLIAAAVKQYLNRETAEPPKWLGKLQTADTKTALKTGLLVILLMPSDIVIMLTVAVNLQDGSLSFVDAVPFIAATTLIAALPLLGYLLFRRRAAVAMPKVRDWMNTKSWLVNIIVFCIFIVLILA